MFYIRESKLTDGSFQLEDLKVITKFREFPKYHERVFGLDLTIAHSNRVEGTTVSSRAGTGHIPVTEF